MFRETEPRYRNRQAVSMRLLRKDRCENDDPATPDDVLPQPVSRVFLRGARRVQAVCVLAECARSVTAPPADPFPAHPKWGAHLLYTDVLMERREVRNYVRRLRELKELRKACSDKVMAGLYWRETMDLECDLRTRLVSHGAAWSEYLKAKRKRHIR